VLRRLLSPVYSVSFAPGIARCSRFKETFNRLIIDHFIEFFRLDVVNPLTQLLVFGARLLAGRFSLFRGLLRRPILAH
jgi:hypothetical protein